MPLLDDPLPGRSPELSRSVDAVGAIQPPIDRSAGLAKALSDKAASALPDAFKAEETQAAALRGKATDTVKDLERQQAERAQLKAPLPPAPERRPQPINTDPVNAWGSMAMAFATIASGFTRRPMVNALNGAAAVMNAYRAKDEAAYKTAFDAWKADTEYTGKLYEYQRDAYKDAIDTLDKDEKTAMAKLKVAASALNDDPMKRAIELQGAAGAIELERQRSFSTEKLALENKNLMQQGEALGEALAAQKALQANPNDPEAQQRFKNAHDTLRLIKEGKGSTIGDQRLQTESELYERLKTDWQNANPDKEYSGAIEAELRGQAHSSISGRGQGQMKASLDDATLGRMADQYLAGQHNVVQGLGYGNAGAANRAALQNKISEHARKLGEEAGIPEEKLGEFLAIKSAEYAGIVAGERTLGIRTTQLGLAAQEAQLLMPAVLKASEGVDRTELTDLNKLILSAETRTGDPKTVRLGIAINSLINVYARAISPTGVPTVDDKKHFRELMEPYWSKGQIREALEQLNVELDAALGAPARVRQEFREGAGSRASGQFGFPKPAAGSAPAAAPASGGASALPTDLPDPKGRAEGTAVKADGKVIAVIRGGRWDAP